ncbi:MAG: hypothetical protein MUE43_03630, partial [Serpentinimonas sp.]|nr:hypothetical protein [Serpentinimonas sp.]
QSNQSLFHLGNLQGLMNLAARIQEPSDFLSEASGIAPEPSLQGKTFSASAAWSVAPTPQKMHNFGA